MDTYPKRKPLRIPGFDYHAPGAYFVTICTFERRPVLGTIGDNGVEMSEAGLMVAESWAALPGAYRGVLLDEYVVMPNHLHGLLMLNTEPSFDDGRTEPALALPDVMQRFKSWTTTRYRQSFHDQMAMTMSRRLWQGSYHERVVRDERELTAVREYIGRNPERWQQDSEFVR